MLIAGFTGLMLGSACGGGAAWFLVLTRSRRMANNRFVIHLAQIAVLTTAAASLFLLHLLEPRMGIAPHSPSHYVVLYTSLFAWGCFLMPILRAENRLRKSGESDGKNLVSK